MNNWILVVDDDTSNLKVASYILGRVQMRVSSFCRKTGRTLGFVIYKHTGRKIWDWECGFGIDF